MLAAKSIIAFALLPAGSGLRLTSRNTALARCIGDVKASVGFMNSARSTVFGVI
jgi:hypothetical protein